MKKSRLIQISIVILFSLFSFVGHASFDETKARDFLNTTGEKFIETLGLQNVKEKYALLDDMFETKFDTLVEIPGRWERQGNAETGHDQSVFRDSTRFGERIGSSLGFTPQSSQTSWRRIVAITESSLMPMLTALQAMVRG